MKKITFPRIVVGMVFLKKIKIKMYKLKILDFLTVHFYDKKNICENFAATQPWLLKICKKFQLLRAPRISAKL
jgi:hypothetical protein